MLTRRIAKQGGGCCCGGSTANCGSCCTACSPCVIPNADLTLTINGTTVTTLTYDYTVPDWTDGTHTLACSGGTIALTGGGTWTISAHTCNGFSVSFTSGGNTAVVTGTTYGASTCCVPFQINGCVGAGLSNCTITVYDHVGGTVLTSGKTNSSGKATLVWIGTNSIYVTVTEPSGRFAAYGSTPVAFSCANTTPITINMTAASGYHCSGGCNFPIKDTLTFTGGGGTATLQYGIFAASTWSGCYSPSLASAYTAIDPATCIGTIGTANVPTQIDFVPGSSPTTQATFLVATDGFSGVTKGRSFAGSCTSNLLVNTYSGICTDGTDFATDSSPSLTCPLSFSTSGILPANAHGGEPNPAAGAYTITE